MMQFLKIGNYFFLCLLFAFISCKSGGAKNDDSDNSISPSDAQTPVTVTMVSYEPLIQYITLNATSTFLQKNYIKANTAGYVQLVNTQIGKYVNAGELLFILKTKESQSIGNTINKLDHSFKFSGTNRITAARSGFITQLNHQVGDYVQDGEQLAVISDKNSFAFIMDLPYELRNYVLKQKYVEVILPDSTKLNGVIASVMPTVDPSAQTQSIVIKVNSSTPVPENLIAKVKILKAEVDSAQSLPKAAVLTNDVQSDYWVMKMIDSVTAVKVSIKKGIESQDRVQILSPKFAPSDKILITGNYGLGDTAKVKIESSGNE